MSERLPLLVALEFKVIEQLSYLEPVSTFTLHKTSGLYAISALRVVELLRTATSL